MILCMWVCLLHFSSILHEPPQPSSALGDILIPARLYPGLLLLSSLAGIPTCRGVSLHMAVGSDYPQLADFFFFL